MTAVGMESEQRPNTDPNLPPGPVTVRVVKLLGAVTLNLINGESSFVVQPPNPWCTVFPLIDEWQETP